jgi:hypothetical protein
MTNITERCRTRKVLDLDNRLCAIATPEGRIVWSSPLLYPTREFRGRRWQEMVHPDDIGAVMAWHANQAEDGKANKFRAVNHQTGVTSIFTQTKLRCYCDGCTKAADCVKANGNWLVLLVASEAGPEEWAAAARAEVQAIERSAIEAEAAAWETGMGRTSLKTWLLRFYRSK